MSSYSFVIDRTWQSQGERKLAAGLAAMVTDIHSKAAMNAPIWRGSRRYAIPGLLKASGRVEKQGDMSYIVAFGGGSVPYAKRREYENNLNPGTRFYLKRASESVSAKAESYFMKEFS
jgi:hypothetical protein